MKREILFMALLSVGLLASSLILMNSQEETMQFAAVDATLTDAELQCATGEGCVQDCALAATYCGLSVVKWWYAPLCFIYTDKCLNCGGSGGGGCVPTIDESDVCQGSVTTAGPQECDYYGGQIVYYNDGCQGREICCIEDW